MTDEAHASNPASSIDSDSDSDSESSFVEEVGSDGLTRRQRLAKEEEEKVDLIVKDDQLDELAKIDAIADVRHNFKADTTAIDAYLAGHASVEATVAKLADPIDEAYSTANHGRQLHAAERSARNQRKYHDPEKALQMWGPEEDFPEPSEEIRNLPSTEGQLWELWYGVLHAAKRIPWTDTAREGKLLDLVKALKARPDPPQPPRVTVALRRDWIWETGKVWSDLLMLGPSACEAWNDCCGVAAGWTVPEQHAWTNVNAFIARVTANGLADFRSYGVRAACQALEYGENEDHNLHHNAPYPLKLELYVTVAAVWMLLAGECMYKECKDNGDSDGGHHVKAVDVSSRGEQLPWFRQGDPIALVQWNFWRRRFDQEAHNDQLPWDVRELAIKSADRMLALEQPSAREEEP
ncbi:Uu.00g069600.m01.CDS01 [Anthostomella pinea]|uniref:Uu.00g069600.m01.CDS01 n=1 Tax=Anthostomella pinea TaxID=933095 RepID=A0AAI8VV61_9PEZI|nr:Uu.00g069600.m01.CDS01 [Anthostomella pinea]